MAETEHTDPRGLAGEPGTMKEDYPELFAALERLEKAVRERPLMAVGIAVAAGFMLSALLRR